MTPINLEPIEISEEFKLPLAEYKELKKESYRKMIEENGTENPEEALARAIQIEIEYYIEMKTKSELNELLKSWLALSPDMKEKLEKLASEINHYCFYYYRKLERPPTMGDINRRFLRPWRKLITTHNISDLMTVLCENGYIRFEVLASRTGARIIVPSVLRRLENNSEYPDFKFHLMGRDENYPKLTGELLLGYM